MGLWTKRASGGGLGFAGGEEKSVRHFRPRDPRNLELFRSLSQETNPEIYFASLLALGRNLEVSEDRESAAEVYSAIRESENVPAEIRQDAQERIDAMSGGGPVGRRAEILLKDFTQTATDYRTIIPMMGASVLYQAARTASLNRLASTTRSTWLTRGAGARIRAALVGTAWEVPAFSFLHRGLREISGEDLSWTGESVCQDLARTAITLGALKLSASAGSQMGVKNRLIPSASSFLGLVGGHRLQVAFQLHPQADGATVLTDSVANFIALGIGAHLGRRMLGNNIGRWHRELETRIQSPPATEFPWAFATSRSSWVSSGGGIGLAENEALSFMTAKKGLPAGNKRVTGPLRVHGIARFLDAVEKVERGEKASSVDLYGLGKADVLAFLNEKRLGIDSAFARLLLENLFLHGAHRASQWASQILLSSDAGIHFLQKRILADPNRLVSLIDAAREMVPDSRKNLDEFHLTGTLETGARNSLFSGLIEMPGIRWKVEGVREDRLTLAESPTPPSGARRHVFTINGANFSRNWLGHEFFLLPEVAGGHDGKESESGRKKNPAAQFAQKSGGVAIQAISGERFWLKIFSARLATYLPGEWSRHRIFSIREEINANRQLMFRVKSAGPSPVRGQPGHHIYEFELSPKEALALGLFTEEGELRRVSGGPEIFVIPEHLSVTAQETIPDTSLSESKTTPPVRSYASRGSETLLEPHEPLEVFTEGLGRFFLFYPKQGLPLLRSIPVRIARMLPDKMLVSPLEPKQEVLHGNDIILNFDDPHPFSIGDFAMLVLPVTKNLPE